MIRFERVAKRYPPDVEVFVDLSCEIAAGEAVVVTGPSGAGKSTFLKLIAAIERPSAGAILVGGQNVAALPEKALPFLRRGIGFVFQDLKLLADRSALDNVLLPLEIAGFAADEARRRAEAALAKVGLVHRARARPEALSGGEQQCLAMARAIVHRPRLLLVDEPTAHLDQEAAARVTRLLAEFHALGVTTVVASCTADALPRARVIALSRPREDER